MDTDADDSDDRDPSPYSDDDSGPLWVKTPLIRSPHTSARLGLNAYLKMEVMQWTTSPLRVWLTKSPLRRTSSLPNRSCTAVYPTSFNRPRKNMEGIAHYRCFRR